MEEKVMYQRITRNTYESPQYSDRPDYNERYTYINQNKNFNDNSNVPYFNSLVSPRKFYKSTNAKEYKMKMKPKFFRNCFDNYYNAFEAKKNINNNNYDNYNNNYDNYNYDNYNNHHDYNRFRKSNNLNNKNSNINMMSMSQDMPSPLYYSNNKNNSVKRFNNSQGYNGNTTDEGESYINYNRDSNFFSQKPYKGFSVIQTEEDNITSNDSNVEQLIIYPENNYINDNELFFDNRTKEGMLRPKNLETYTVSHIEYVPEDKHKYKPVTLGDYLLKSANKSKKNLRTNKSCNRLNSDMDENDYLIKVTKNKKLRNNKIKNKEKKASSSCENIYKRKEINDKIYISDTYTNNTNNTNNINNTTNKKKKKNIFKLLDFFHKDTKDLYYDSDIKDETNEEKGGIVYFSNKKRNTRNYNVNYNINKNNYKYVKYPQWKIVSAACLIQSWWRSLKLLYKKYLDKIIIIQKVYKMHYKKMMYNKTDRKYMSSNIFSRKNMSYGGKYLLEPVAQLDSNISYLKSMDRYNRQTKSVSNSKYIYNKKKQKLIYDRSNINNYDNELSYQQNISFSYYNNNFYLGLLLLKKILENKLIKIFHNVVFKINNCIDSGSNYSETFRYRNYNKKTIHNYRYKYKNNFSNNINNTNNYSYSKRQKKHVDVYEKKNLMNDYKKNSKLLCKSDEEKEFDINGINGSNLKPINIYATQNKKKNFLHLNIVTPNNNFSLTYKGSNDSKSISDRYSYNNDILSINNIYSFSINNTNNYVPYITVNQKQRKYNDTSGGIKNNDLVKGNTLNERNIKNEQNNKDGLMKGNVINSKEMKIQNEITNEINNIKIISQPKTLPIQINKKKGNNKTNENYNKGTVILNDKKQILKQSLLLQKIFLKIWYKQAQAIKHAKRAHRKDKNDDKIKNKKKNNHILLSNLIAYVFDKIKKEIKRRKLIICLKNINKMKYPNLQYAFKKIKKFSKVRFKVMNEYASIIQYAFRYYLENKKKEEILNNQDNKNNIDKQK